MHSNLSRVRVISVRALMEQDIDEPDAAPPGFRTTVVKTGLRQFCRYPALVQQIEGVVQNATVVAYEGSKLLNLFFLHLLENKLPIPKLDGNWIYTNVYQSLSVNRTQQQPRPSPCAQLEYVRQHLYLPHRPPNLGWGVRDNMGQVLKQLSKDTLVNCKNHVAVNFHKRLRRWWFGKLTRKLQTQLVRRDRWCLADTLVTAACNDKTGFGMPRRVQLTLQEIHYLKNKLTELGAESEADSELCPRDPAPVSNKKLSYQVLQADQETQK